jgi:hypothetical protein
MKLVLWMGMIVVSLSLAGKTQDQESPTPSTSSHDSRVFREPFTLRVRVDKNHYYEEQYDKRIPYVSDNDVYIFSGENFGLNLASKDNGVAEVTYQPDIKRADIWLSFAQPKDLGGVVMMLTIQNKLKRTLQMDGLMTVPGKKEGYKTTIVPIEAGLSDFESWPHPIIQLVLSNFRVSASETKKSKP